MSSSLSIWQNVCLASAWFSRAQQTNVQSKNNYVDQRSPTGGDNNTEGGGDNQQRRVVGRTFAERSLSLYQSCYKQVKKEEKMKSFAGGTTSVKNNCNDEIDSAAYYTINLELRMAQTLRFLAHLHSNTDGSSNNDIPGGDETEENSHHAHDMNNDIEKAIKYHDMAVSLLVGVYDDDDEEDDDEEENDNVANNNNNNISSPTSCSNSGIMKSRDSPSHEHYQSSVVEGDDDDEIWSVSAADTFSESQEDNDSITNEAGEGGKVVLRIHIPNNTKLNEHIVNPQSADQHPTTSSANNYLAAATGNTIATFVQPTESQRVRAIATSLNALAELHAMNGNDRAAMDSFREALEILRAATEENNDNEGGEMMEYNEEEGGGEPPELSVGQQGQPSHNKSNNTSNANNGDSSSGISPIQIDLANTLMNVGNFHLRRDELDAALNAYSTVWALHSGTSLDDEEDATANNVHTPSTPSNSSVTVSTSVTSSSVPYLTPQQQHTPKSLSQSSFNTPNSSNNNATPSSSTSSSSLGGLVALNNLGIVHERRNELSEALSCFEHVYQTRTAILGNDHTDTVNALINLANVYQRLQNWDKACISYQEVVNVYKRKMIRWHNTMMNIGNSGDKDDVSSAANKNTVVKLHHSLAGALRNYGTCYWKQRRISEAIDKLIEAVGVEEQIVTILSSSSSSSGASDASVKRAKESMAQLLGLLGCLYLEYKLDELKSYDKSKEVFQRAIQIYSELGYDTSHPSVSWTYQNLGVVERQGQVPPPPPPPPPVTSNLPTVPIATTPLNNEDGENKDNNVVDDVVDLDDIDSIELDRVLATDDENTDVDGDDIFLGVEANSTDELDAFLNSGEEEAVLPTNEEVVVRDNGEETTSDQINRPLSNQHRNFSATFLNEQGDDQKKEDDDIEERLSQLQLQAESDECNNLEAAHANVELAEVFWGKGDRVTATQHLTEAHSLFAQLNEQKEVALVLKRLGDLNQEDKALDAAKELYKEALEIEIDVYGQHLPQTLNAAGRVCLLQEDFRSAMDFHRQALQIQKHKSQQQGGEARQDKYEMYETLVRIGNVYYSERNNYNNIRSKGVDYREFIESGFLGWIANAHDMRGEYIKAIQFYEESCEVHRSRKGKDAKREMALTLNRLGSLTRELGRYDEAMDYHQKALNIQKSSSGAGKAMAAETCVLMGMVKARMGSFKSALNLYEDSILVLESTLGEDHLSVSKTMTQIGSVYFELSNYDQAMAILREAERWQLTSMGENNRDICETQALIGRVLSATGKYEEALRQLRSVAERQRKLFSSKHPTIADTLTYLGDCYLEQGDATKARAEYVLSYNMRKSFFSVDMVHIAMSMVDIIRARTGQPDRALAIYKNAGEVYKEYLSDDHVEIGRLYTYEGDSYAELLNFPVAIERYEKAKQIFHKAFGESTIESALVAVATGKVLLRKCDYESAKDSFTFALNIYEQILPEGHQKITSTLANLDRVEQEELLCV